MNKKRALEVWQLYLDAELEKFKKIVSNWSKYEFCDFLYFVINDNEDISPLDIIADIQSVYKASAENLRSKA